MQHIGIDLGGKESRVCVRNEDGTIAHEDDWPTHGLATLLGDQSRARIIMETCAEAFAVADGLRKHGHDVRIVPTTIVRQLGVGARGMKTDAKDARALSAASCRSELPSVHVPSEQHREYRTILTMRDSLVASRTMFTNNVKGWMRTQLIKKPRGGKYTFTNRLRAQLIESRGAVPNAIERQLQMIDILMAQIKAADAELKEIADNNKTCQLLMTAPGIGPITSLYFLTTVDEVKRFKTAHDLESYLGLTPGESSSSSRKSRTGITKAGASRVRRVLVQSAWVIWMKKRNDPLALWGREVAARRGVQIAVVGMARRLSGILYAMWSSGQTYDPSKAMQVRLADRLAG